MIVSFYHFTQEEFKRSDKTQLMLNGIKQFFKIQKTEDNKIKVRYNSLNSSKMYLKKPEKIVRKDSRVTKVAFNRNQISNQNSQASNQNSQISNQNSQSSNQNSQPQTSQVEEKMIDCDNDDDVIFTKIKYKPPPIVDPKKLPQITFFLKKPIEIE